MSMSPLHYAAMYGRRTSCNADISTALFTSHLDTSGQSWNIPSNLSYNIRKQCFWHNRITNFSPYLICVQSRFIDLFELWSTPMIINLMKTDQWSAILIRTHCRLADTKKEFVSAYYKLLFCIILSIYNKNVIFIWIFCKLWIL